MKSSPSIRSNGHPKLLSYIFYYSFFFLLTGIFAFVLEKGKTATIFIIIFSDFPCLMPVSAKSWKIPKNKSRKNPLIKIATIFETQKSRTVFRSETPLGNLNLRINKLFFHFTETANLMFPLIICLAFAGMCVAISVFQVGIISLCLL